MSITLLKSKKKKDCLKYTHTKFNIFHHFYIWVKFK